MLITLLVAIRDAILAAALGWVGISVEQRGADQPCAQGAGVCERAN